MEIDVSGMGGHGKYSSSGIIKTRIKWKTKSTVDNDSSFLLYIFSFYVAKQCLVVCWFCRGAGFVLTQTIQHYIVSIFFFSLFFFSILTRVFVCIIQSLVVSPNASYIMTIMTTVKPTFLTSNFLMLVLLSSYNLTTFLSLSCHRPLFARSYR